MGGVVLDTEYAISVLKEDKRNLEALIEKGFVLPESASVYKAEIKSLEFSIRILESYLNNKSRSVQIIQGRS